MADQDVLQRVTKVTSKVLGLDPAEIQPDANFVFDLGAESSQSLELVMGFEAEFDIEMNQEEALAVQTVGGAAEYIGQQLQKK
jgi:acyl carrier protein